MEKYHYNEKNARIISGVWLIATALGLFLAYRQKSKWYGYLGWGFLFGVIGSTGANLFYPMWELNPSAEKNNNDKNVSELKYRLNLNRKELKEPDFKLTGAATKGPSNILLKTPDFKLSNKF